MLHYVKIPSRYMMDLGLGFPGIVYLQPEVAEMFSFAAWCWTNQHGVIVCPLPRNVFNWLNTANLGLLRKVRRDMYPHLLKR